MILVVMVVLFCRLMDHEMSQEFACRDDTIIVHLVAKARPFHALDRHAVSFKNAFCVSHRSKGHDGISLAMDERTGGFERISDVRLSESNTAPENATIAAICFERRSPT
jgi:hypothetical protein